MIDSYIAFMMAYYILDAVSDEMDSEDVRKWSTEINPFLFKDVGSADPAAYIEFEKEWDDRYGKGATVDEEECKAFLLKNTWHGFRQTALAPSR